MKSITRAQQEQSPVLDTDLEALATTLRTRVQSLGLETSRFLNFETELRKALAEYQKGCRQAFEAETLRREKSKARSRFWGQFAVGFGASMLTVYLLEVLKRLH